jgi:hypothetical protein
MHTRRPLLIFVILGLLGALLFSGTAAAETQPAPTPEPPANPEPTPQPTPEPEQPEPSTALVCNLWDGEPYDYWKVREMSAADADWWVANSANASIVEGSGACPGNAPVSLCIPDGDLDKLIVVEPWDANWYLANVAGAKKAVNGSCKTEVVTDPKPEPTTDPKPEPTTDPKPEPTTDPKPEPTTDPKPEPTTDPKPEPTPDGDVDSSGGNADGGDDDTTTAVQGIAQERQELAVTGVESWHLALAGMTMLSMGMIINTLRRRVTPAEVAAHARR